MSMYDDEDYSLIKVTADAINSEIEQITYEAAADKVIILNV